MEEKVVEQVKEKVEEITKAIANEVQEDTSWMDIILEKVISRKLLVWLAATGFLIYSKIDGDQWIALSLAYIGLQGAADIVTNYMAARK